MGHTNRTGRIMCKSPEESFALRTERRGDCLIWTGAVHDMGYGIIWNGTKIERAHRWAYRTFIGPISDAAEIDHMCSNRLCCEPRHLRATTHKQNCENLRLVRSNSRTGIRGVSRNTKGGKPWRARVKHNYREYSAGTHDTIEEAEAAAIALRMKLFTHSIETLAA